VQWYVYLISIPAAAVLGQLALEFIKRPIATALCLRRQALERIIFFKDMSLPRPRELATCSRDIRAHDQAVRGLTDAQRTFADLGEQLLVLSESEPLLQYLMTLFGLNIVQAGQELINLSQAYAMAKIDSDERRQEIENAFCAVSAALTASRRPSRHDLMNIRLEPMYLRSAGRISTFSGGQ
jgi:hypothetical protein